MKRTVHTAEQIIRILREAETTGTSVEELCRQHNVGRPTFYRWKRKYGGMGVQEVQRLRELEHENGELKKLLADELLRNKALKMALEKNV
jgi:putative transposase